MNAGGGSSNQRWMRRIALMVMAVVCSCSGDAAVVLDAALLDGAAPDVPVLDAALDGAVLDAAAVDAPLDATAVDAPLDATIVDAVRIDAPSPLCEPSLNPLVITAPMSQQSWTPFGSLTGVALYALDTPVPLESIWVDVPTLVNLSVYATCAAPLATGTQHSFQFDIAFSQWTDATVGGPLAAGRYVVDVRLFFPWGFSRITVRGTIADGGACTGPLVASGVLACSPRASCLAGVCAVAACGNGVDDDGDGLADDADPGCALARDDEEADACGSGGPCPECADAVDSDGDGRGGWPADLGCARAGDPVEHNCPDSDGVIEVVDRSAHPLSTTAANDQPGVLHCGSSSADHVFHLAVPGDLTSLSVGVGQQAIGLRLYRDTCAGMALMCMPAVPGWAAIPLGAVPAGDYWVVANPGAATQQVSFTGTYASGARCDPTRTTFACAGGQSCLPAAGGGHRCQ